MICVENARSNRKPSSLFFAVEAVLSPLEALFRVGFVSVMRLDAAEEVERASGNSLVTMRGYSTRLEPNSLLGTSLGTGASRCVGLGIPLVTINNVLP